MEEERTREEGRERIPRRSQETAGNEKDTDKRRGGVQSLPSSKPSLTSRPTRTEKVAGNEGIGLEKVRKEEGKGAKTDA